MRRIYFESAVCKLGRANHKVKAYILRISNMPKPKKNEMYATYNNDFCYEKGFAALKKMQPDISLEPLDSHTIKILLKAKGDRLEQLVRTAVSDTKGYIEHDLETINALRVPKKKSGDSGVLDTPFYG